jgi:hypothetical protein
VAAAGRPAWVRAHDPARSALATIDPQKKTRNHFRRQHQHDRRKNPQVQGLDGLKGPQGTLGIFIRKGPATRRAPRRAAHPVEGQRPVRQEPPSGPGQRAQGAWVSIQQSEYHTACCRCAVHPAPGRDASRGSGESDEQRLRQRGVTIAQGRACLADDSAVPGVQSRTGRGRSSPPSVHGHRGSG